jgi:hypothetical protein
LLVGLYGLKNGHFYKYGPNTAQPKILLDFNFLPDSQYGTYNYCKVPYFNYFRKIDVKLLNHHVLNLVWQMLLSWVNDRGHIDYAIFADNYCRPRDQCKQFQEQIWPDFEMSNPVQPYLLIFPGIMK